MKEANEVFEIKFVMNYDGLGLALRCSGEQSVPIRLLDVSIIHSCLEEEEEEEE